MTVAPLESVPFSDLLRHTTETTERLSHARAVRLQRRDAADLVLMSAERADAEAEIVEVAAQLLAQLVRLSPDLVSTALPLALPWVQFLPPDDVATMAAEFVSTAVAATALGNTAAVTQLLAEWRHTAEVHADPELYRALTQRPLGDFGSVPRPAAA
jgi:hypothetical protein